MKQILTILYFFLSLWLLSCSGSLPPPLETVKSDTDWELFGGNPAHTGYRDIAIKLPLKEKWQFSLTTEAGQAFVAVGGVAYVGCLDGTVQAINIKTGEEMGSEDFDSAIYGNCLVKQNYLVYARAMGKTTLTFYDLITKKTIYTRTVGPVESSPTLVGQVMFIAGINQNLYAYTFFNGSEKWVFRSQKPMRTTPAFSNETVIVADDGGWIYAIDSFGQKKWTFPTQGPVFGSAMISGDRVYIGSHDSTLYCLDLQSGSLIWKKQLDGKINSTPSEGSQNIYLGTNGGTFFAIQKNDGKISWKFSAKSVINSPAVVTRNIIFFGSLDHFIYGLDPESGSLLWKVETTGRIKSAPLLWKDILLVAAENNKLYAFESER